MYNNKHGYGTGHDSFEEVQEEEENGKNFFFISYAVCALNCLMSSYFWMVDRCLPCPS